MKTYDDLAGDGGSNVLEQVLSQRERNCENDSIQSNTKFP